MGSAGEPCAGPAVGCDNYFSSYLAIGLGRQAFSHPLFGCCHWSIWYVSSDLGAVFSTGRPNPHLEWLASGGMGSNRADDILSILRGGIIVALENKEKVKTPWK